MELYPLKFREIIRRYPFGGNRIERYFKKGLQGKIAETWEIVDLWKDRSVVKNGKLSGRNLHELVVEYKEKLIGEAYRKHGCFPLLIKFLDAEKILPPQVHPPDDYARVHENEKFGKTEAWYIIDAMDGATVYCGNRKGLSRENFRKEIEGGKSFECMERIPVKKGDLIFVPAGRPHAICSGILLWEIQQSCDITYAWDWLDWEISRERREEDVRKAMDVLLIEDVDHKIPPLQMESGINRIGYLVACRYFAVEHLLVKEKLLQKTENENFFILTVIAGNGEIVYDDRTEEFRSGETILIPASLGNFEIFPEIPSEILKSYVPDLEKLVKMLESKFGRDEILRLGGYGKMNDLARILT
jgi:mannose-6-phosphate isomerase